MKGDFIMLVSNDKYLEALAIKVGIPKIMCNYPQFMVQFKQFVEGLSAKSISKWYISEFPSDVEIENIKSHIEPNIRRSQGKVDEEAIRKEKLDRIQESSSLSIVYDPEKGPNALPSVVFDDYDREPIGNGARHVQNIYTVDSQNSIERRCTSKVKDDYLGQSISRSNTSGKVLETTRIEYNPKNGEPQLLNHENARGEVDFGKTFKDGRLASDFTIEYLDYRTRASSSRQYDENGRVISTGVNRVIDNVVRYSATSRLDRDGKVIDVCEKEFRPDRTLSAQRVRNPNGALISSGVYGEDGISNVTEEYYKSGAVKRKTSFSKDSEGKVTSEEATYAEDGMCSGHFMEKVVNGRVSAKAVEHFENGKSIGADFTKYRDDGRPEKVDCYYPSKRIKSSTKYEYPNEHTVSYSRSGYAENGVRNSFTRGQIIDGLKRETVTHLDEQGNPTGVEFLNYDSDGNIIKDSQGKDVDMDQAKG